MARVKAFGSYIICFTVFAFSSGEDLYTIIDEDSLNISLVYNSSSGSSINKFNDLPFIKRQNLSFVI
jgi:hypothetical protein